MGRYLLLGAGFSRNWGAPLAKEFTGSLLGDLHDDDVIAKALRENNNFEAVLGELQGAAKSNKETAARLLRLEQAIAKLFDRINSSLAGRPLNFNENTALSIGDFLSRFDAIFTLNQDLLLEAHYLKAHYHPKWTAVVLPGMDGHAGGGNMVGTDILKATWTPSDHPPIVQPKHQPIYKLHGSSSWRTADAASMLVMGSGKAAAIDRFPVLKAYHHEFRRRLEEPQNRLMVIGYSFQDPHINGVIQGASDRAGLGVYIIDPGGADVLRNARDPRIGPIGQTPADIERIRLVGELRRPLKEIFSPDGDFVRGELFRFFS